MTTLYAESSAVLRWLLGADAADVVEEALGAATSVVASDLTTAEVGRALRRLTVAGVIDEAASERAWATYAAASAHWSFHAVTEPVLARVRQPFPAEPVRTLDAIHLATATLYGAQVAAPSVLSVDRQVRLNARALGLAVLPAE